MAIAEGDILKAVWTAKVDGVGTRVQNVYTYRINTLVSSVPEDVSDDFDSFITSGYTVINAQLSSDYVAESLRITNMSKKEFVGDEVPVFAGTGAAGGSMPAQVAIEILGRARVLGHVARKYVGPPMEDALTDGKLTAAALVAFRTYRDFFISNFLGLVTNNDYIPVMVKVAVGGGVASTIDLDEDLGFVVQTARTMRSRIPGRGLT